MIDVQKTNRRVSKDLIIYRLANKYNLPIKKIKEIVEYQFKYTTEVMKKGDFEAIRLPYFGKFSVNPRRVEYINKKNDTKD